MRMVWIPHQTRRLMTNSREGQAHPVSSNIRAGGQIFQRGILPKVFWYQAFEQAVSDDTHKPNDQFLPSMVGVAGWACVQRAAQTLSRARAFLCQMVDNQYAGLATCSHHVHFTQPAGRWMVR